MQHAGRRARPVVGPAQPGPSTRRLELTAWVGQPDGSAWIADRLRGGPDGLGRAVAERLLSVGAGELLE